MALCCPFNTSFQEIWIVNSSEIQDAYFVSFETNQLQASNWLITTDRPINYRFELQRVTH